MVGCTNKFCLIILLIYVSLVISGVNKYFIRYDFELCTVPGIANNSNIWVVPMNTRKTLYNDCASSFDVTSFDVRYKCNILFVSISN